MKKKTIRDVTFAAVITTLLWSSAKADSTSHPDGSGLSTLSTTREPGGASDRIASEPADESSKSSKKPLPAIGRTTSSENGTDTIRRKSDEKIQHRPNALGMDNKLNQQRLDSDVR